ncbi:MAG: nicotinate-nucleotide--dimethylbenzimidazole phosphoribosyltransferase, partial [Oscillospiraceae bacterium]|nr:nicotinate-nucleotide--dimethylbenzimidazole phosphoribosyltransferase [Oscillospiraceae bacterium]
MKLDEIIAGIPKIPAERYRAARQHWDALAKPLGSLGVLEENVTKIAALSGKRQLSRRTLLVF